MTDINAIKARAKAATPGPWDWHKNAHPNCNGTQWGWVSGPDGNVCFSGVQAGKDAIFIAHAREDIPALITEVERLNLDLKAANKRAERLAKKCRDARRELRRFENMTDEELGEYLAGM
jgi:hypothetical protein